KAQHLARIGWSLRQRELEIVQATERLRGREHASALERLEVCDGTLARVVEERAIFHVLISYGLSAFPSRMFIPDDPGASLRRCARGARFSRPTRYRSGAGPDRRLQSALNQFRTQPGPGPRTSAADRSASTLWPTNVGGPAGPRIGAHQAGETSP